MPALPPRASNDTANAILVLGDALPDSLGRLREMLAVTVFDNVQPL